MWLHEPMYFLVKDYVCWRLKDWWYWKMDIPHFPASNFYRISSFWFGSLAGRKATYASPIGNFHIMPILNASCEGFQIPTIPLWSFYHAQPHHPMLASLGSIVESETGLDWKGPWRCSSSNPPAVDRDTFHYSGCSKAHPPWPWTFQGMGQPQFLWPTSFSVSPPSQ